MPQHALRLARRGRHRSTPPSRPVRWTAAGAVALITVTLLGAPLGPATAAPAADAGTTVTAGADVYVSEAAPRLPYDRGRLAVDNRSGQRKVSYLKFDVPALPPGATVASASVVLTRDRGRLPGSVDLSRVSSTSWTEKSVTYANAPAVGRRLAGATPAPNAREVTFTLPAGTVTAAGLYAFALSTVEEGIGRFRSHERGASGPRLVLTFDGGEPPPGGGLSDVWVGAAASEPAGGGAIDYSVGVFNESNEDIGPLVYRRSFDTSLPTSFQNSAARDDAANGYRSFVSWKPPNGDYVGAAQGKYDAQVTAWAASVPRTGVYATSFHEPENDMTGPQFVALQQHLYTVVKAANSAIRWGPVYMAYWWDDGTSHYVGDKDAWWPGNAYADFTAVDVYSNHGLPLENHPEFRGWYDYMLGTGEEMIIAEYGQYVVPPGGVADPAKLAERAEIIAEDAAWLADEGTISMWLYWDAMGDKGDWRLNDPTSQDAWQDVSQAGREGELRMGGTRAAARPV